MLSIAYRDWALSAYAHIVVATLFCRIRNLSRNSYGAGPLSHRHPVK